MKFAAAAAIAHAFFASLSERTAPRRAMPSLATKKYTATVHLTCPKTIRCPQEWTDDKEKDLVIQSIMESYCKNNNNNELHNIIMLDNCNYTEDRVVVEASPSWHGAHRPGRAVALWSRNEIIQSDEPRSSITQWWGATLMEEKRHEEGPLSVLGEANECHIEMTFVDDAVSDDNDNDDDDNASMVFQKKKPIVVHLARQGMESFHQELLSDAAEILTSEKLHREDYTTLMDGANENDLFVHYGTNWRANNQGNNNKNHNRYFAGQYQTCYDAAACVSDIDDLCPDAPEASSVYLSSSNLRRPCQQKEGCCCSFFPDKQKPKLGSSHLCLKRLPSMGRSWPMTVPLISFSAGIYYKNKEKDFGSTA